MLTLQIREHAQEGDTGREVMRHKEFTFDFSFWSVLRTDPHFASQEQVTIQLSLEISICGLPYYTLMFDRQTM